MKTIKVALLGLGILSLGSCTTYHTAIVTNNPVGNKIGVAKAKVGDVDANFTYKSAMKNGKITKAGIAETKVKGFFIFYTGITIVTGE